MSLMMLISVSTEASYIFLLYNISELYPILFEIIFAVSIVLFAGLEIIKSISYPFLLSISAIKFASNFPLFFNGLSKSSKDKSFQLDFACLTKNKNLFNKNSFWIHITSVIIVTVVS